MTHRIHVFGASGSGTTTLGAALAARLALRHVDVDDVYWKRTDPPYTQKHTPAERIAAIERRIRDRDGWILTGSLVSWGDVFVGRFTLAVFLSLDDAERMRRLRARERARYGERIAPGGDLAEHHREFMDWAARYETAGPEMRSRAMHERWLKTLPCPVVALDGARPVDASVDAIVEALRAPSPAAPPGDGPTVAT
ncbi:AAA family ATPase [Luteimonas huabeiensis]|uniref:AAA family ATPase n=1 Tax=Luteimonas huabeiensis TaxID=1244513 RepID=UPI000467D860|nr:AAA family ATPase [Luteimonas huabeiensis]